MKKELLILVVVIIGLCGIVSAATTGDALAAVSARLVEAQTADGSWPDELYYSGSIVAGLVDAYKFICDENILAVAEAGGNFIIQSAGGNYFGDEAYALAGLGRISNDPRYLFEAQDFYRWIKEDTAGTQSYLDGYQEMDPFDPSIAAFYISHHVIAAYRVNAADKQIWRDMLRYYLAQVNDTNYYPVLALGAATWALAQTDTGLDSLLPVIPQGKTGDSFWNGVSLAELPQLISDVQVTASPVAGAFYDRLQPAAVDDYNGYTQDAVYCALALNVARQNSPQAGFDADMSELYQALMSGVYFDSSQANTVATVFGYLWSANPQDEYYFYAANMLMGLSSLVLKGDVDLNDFVGPADLAAFAGQWLSNNTNCCLAADFDDNGKVEFHDFALMSKNWQTGR